jgi:hypothetical protein
LIRVSFFNDYHRFISQNLLELLQRVSTESYGKVALEILGGSAMNSTFEWLRFIDRQLYELKVTEVNTDKMIEHFEVKEIFESRDKFYDLVHGQGASERIRNSVAKLINNNKDECKGVNESKI